MKSTESIVVVGASVRAAAFSAIRGGLCPVAADRFADSDLSVRCRAERVENYPDALVQIFAQLPPGPWMYTGALENRPELVAELSKDRRLLGNSADVLRIVRDPFRVADAYRRQDIPFPELSAGPPRKLTPDWLDKPTQSSGGSEIVMVNAPPTPPLPTPGKRKRYYQRFISGQPCSALFVANRRQCVMIGVTHQLAGERWCGATGFLYCGSFGPIVPTESVRTQFNRIGQCLTNRFALTGVFGVDAILGDGVVWPIEVNPRYTASAELFDWALNASVVRWHVDACQAGTLPTVPHVAPLQCFGKSILYAAHDAVASQRFLDTITLWNESNPWPQVADIPSWGAILVSGQPVVTVLAAAETANQVCSVLRERTIQLAQLLDP